MADAEYSTRNIGTTAFSPTVCRISLDPPNFKRNNDCQRNQGETTSRATEKYSSDFYLNIQ
jgi:hypothetical protein